MKNDLKKIFFCSLLTTLFVISNLVGFKYTYFMDMVVSVNFITYPFITLCILILLHMFGKKDTYYAIISTVFIQVFVLFGYSIIVNMGQQMIIPDLSNSVNDVFRVNEISILASLIGFLGSNYIIIFLYDFFEKHGKRIIGVILGTILSLAIYGLVYILICYFSFEKEILVNMMFGYGLVNLFMSVFIIILFYLLKGKDLIYTEEKSSEIILCFENENDVNDKTIVDVIDVKKQVEKEKKTIKKKSETNKKKALNNKKNIK